MRRDVQGQSGTGRTAVPAQKNFLVPQSLCPGTKTNSLSWDKRRDKSSSKNPGTNSYVPGQKMSKKPNIFFKKFNFFFSIFLLFFPFCTVVVLGLSGTGCQNPVPAHTVAKYQNPVPSQVLTGCTGNNGFQKTDFKNRLKKNRFQITTNIKKQC